MYTTQQYIKRGFRFISNKALNRKIKLSTLMIYATDSCNSKCKHCNIWQKNPKQHLSLKLIKNILSSSAITKDTVIGLEGGEFILHPQAEEILTYFTHNNIKFDLLSNCLAVSNLTNILNKYAPQHLYVSFDGTKETYKNMRGVDGYEKLISIFEKFSKKIPISAMFTLSPFNTFNDLNEVTQICNQYEIDLRIGIYSNMDYFDTNINPIVCQSLAYEKKDLPKEINLFDENYDFMALFPNYRKGQLKLPCFSLYDSLVIYPNGDVPLCQHKNIIIGNINNQPLDYILNCKDTKKLRNEYCKNCNDCWINFHRKYDIVLMRNLEKIAPKKIIELVTGPYQWDKNTELTYKQIINCSKN